MKVLHHSFTLLAVLLLTFVVSLLVTSCETDGESQADSEISQLFTTIPAEAPAPEENPMTEAKIALGHKLFFEPLLSRSKTISCNTCHVVGAAGIDHREVASGEQGRLGARNTPTVFNAAFLKAQFWDGRAATLEEQAGGPIQAHVEMDLTPDEAMQRLQTVGYQPYFEDAFPDEESPFTFDNLTKAIASFERTLTTPGSPFDRYLEGEEDALTPLEKEGLALFQQSGCVGCHNGPLLGGRSFTRFTHAAEMEGEDMGRYEATGNPGDKYVFRVAPLRNVEHTYPYFHDGSAETLTEAVGIMGESQLGRTFNEEETEKLVAFLKTLTGNYPSVTHPRLPR